MYCIFPFYKMSNHEVAFFLLYNGLGFDEESVQQEGTELPSPKEANVELAVEDRKAKAGMGL
jgi:hypothetical protein